MNPFPSTLVSLTYMTQQMMPIWSNNLDCGFFVKSEFESQFFHYLLYCHGQVHKLNEIIHGNHSTYSRTLGQEILTKHQLLLLQYLNSRIIYSFYVPCFIQSYIFPHLYINEGSFLFILVACTYIYIILTYYNFILTELLSSSTFPTPLLNLTQ